MSVSVGQYLINNNIPDKYKIGNKSTSKDIYRNFEQWAKEDPQGYSNNITNIKRIGDHISTYEGLSIGMDDIAPMKRERDQFYKKYDSRMNSSSSIAGKKKILSEATLEASRLAMKGSGSMVDMVRTGAKGNPSQLMKNTFSPVSSRSLDNTPYPYLIKNNYSEGLSNGEYWVSAIEARNATIEGKMNTAIPGDFGKQMFNALNDMVVTTNDCGTRNGISFTLDDNNLIDRYLAESVPSIGSRNTLVTTKLVMAAKKKGIKTLLVRSTVSCEARNGVCQKCYGLNPTGKQLDIGSNVGTIAAQSLSEPLTQMILSSKHGVTLSSKARDDIGMKGVGKLLSKPKQFPNKAALAQLDGTVNKIIRAPQGGHYVHVNSVEHYVPINNKVSVRKGQRVTQGDSLSDGLKDPREFTALKGLGSGRDYLINALYNAYNPMDESTGKRTGIPVDKRHLEVLAKKDLNHVVIRDHNDTFSKGDVVEYNKLKSYMAKSIREVPLKESIGEYLGKEYSFYTVGTRITPEIAKNLQNRGIRKVIVTKNKMKFDPLVVNIRQVPLLKKNFIGRLSHIGLKNSLIQAATEGEKSEISGYDPIPGFVRGVEFGEGTDGRY